MTWAALPSFQESSASRILQTYKTRRSRFDRGAHAATPEVVEERGGTPARAFRFALARDCQWRLLSSATVLRSLAQVVGRAVMLAGGGSLIYYEEPSDFLELHRDIIGCDLAMITSLGEFAPASGGGELLVYPEFRGRPLAAVRAAGRSAATSAWMVPRLTKTLTRRGMQRRWRIVAASRYSLLKGFEGIHR
jgi:hypothetical protein